MIQKDDENDITFGDLLGDPDMDDLNAMMSDLFQQAGIDVDMDNFAERLRISLPVNYAVWAGFLEEILEWPIDNYNEDAEFLEPFAYTTFNGHQVPLYATSLSYAPGDADDLMAEYIFTQIEMKTDIAILFFKAPLVKMIGPNWFSYFGRVLQEGVWKDFLLSASMKGIDSLLAEAVTSMDLDDPNLCYIDKNYELAMSVSAYLAGYDLESDCPSEYLLIGKDDWWKSILF